MPPLNRQCRLRFVLAAFAAAGIASPAPAADVAERVDFYRDGPAGERSVSVWNMARARRPGGVTDDGRHLWLNEDWNARPWAGMTVRGSEALRLTDDWMKRGFVRFAVNATVTRYGQPAGHLELQVKPGVSGGEYQRVRSGHIDRGRGLDQDARSWQEVLIPLSYWTGLEPGDTVTGLSIQCVRKPELAFGLDEIALVRFDELPDWLRAARSREVRQPDVAWPAYDELPPAMRADAAPPEVRDGRFVDPDGKRVFLLSPYTREDARLDLWGSTEPERRPEPHGLFDPDRHGWIYLDLLTGEALSRLGFNCLSVSMPPTPFWDRVGFEGRSSADPDRLGELVQRVGVPFHVDCVCFPWTLGRPAEAGAVPGDALTRGRHHWTPYRIIGPGRKLWLDLWRLYARRYADANASVATFELFNEPAYLPTTDDHREEFETWLRRRYETLDRLNATWGTSMASWREAAGFRAAAGRPSLPNQYFDYDEYLAGRFAELVARGVAAVEDILPRALVGVQTMGGYAMGPKEAIWKHRLVRHETVVLTPTGGGSWTSGSGARERPASALAAPIAPAPLENDLLLALAGEKMILDNELYLEGQSRRDTARTLWKHLICGMDGATVFAWSKRGWAWWKGRDALEVEADKYPYSSLIPLARRTDALRGIHDFARAAGPLADLLLPKPWGPRQRIAFLYDWADARRRTLEPHRLDKRGAYFAALKYTHWNLAVVGSDAAIERGGLDGFDVAILAGTAHAERKLPATLRRFVNAGGALVVGEDTFDRDLYGRPLDTRGLLGCDVAPPAGEPAGDIAVPADLAAPLLPGTVTASRPSRKVALGDANALLTDARGAPVLTRHAIGRGAVYYQAADVIGYPLAKLLAAALRDAAARRGEDAVPASWRAAEVTDADGGLATNVLLSRRSYPQRGHHALLLMNMDEYAKDIRIRLVVPPGRWSAAEHIRRDPIDGGDGKTATAADLAERGLGLKLPPRAPAAVILRRAD